MLADAHCHLQDLTAPEKALKNAEKNGVRLIVSNGVDLDSNQRLAELRPTIPSLVPFFGLHPANCLEQTSAKNRQTISWIEKRLKGNEPNGIGETGLDFLHAQTTRQKKRQQNWFEQQVELAQRFDKPLSIHTRQATTACLNILQKFDVQDVLFHWFCGSFAELQTVCENGFFVSVGPAVFSQKKIQEIAARVPMENLVLETDAPVPFNGKTSEPAWIPQVAQKIAHIRLESVETVAQKTFQNTVRWIGQKTGF